MHLKPELLDTLKQLAYKTPTRIQTLAIPVILEKRDLIAIAQTGTGKTAAFSLPIIQHLSATSYGTKPRALILAPTRELAIQVHNAVVQFCKSLNLSTTLIHGGVSYDPQIENLKAGTDIIVGTPGRIRDHLEQKNISLDRVEFLVLDEADRMLDMGFIEDVSIIIKETPRSRQTSFFSATFSDDVKSLAHQFLKKPQIIHATPQVTASVQVSHVLHPVDKNKKIGLLVHLLAKYPGQQVLIFTRTKVKADEVAKDVTAAGFFCMATHSGRTQAYRTKAMAHFKEGKIQILVATDIAARGLDILDLGLVINYELPNLPEDYVHRIGRTGRAAAQGHALSLITQEELYLLPPIEQLIKMTIPQVWIEGFYPQNFDTRAIHSGQKKKPALKTPKPTQWGKKSKK